MHLLQRTTDLQRSRPEIALALDCAGVTGVRRSVRVGAAGEPCSATIDAYVDLAASSRGVHMSRFHEVVAEAIDETVAATGVVAIDRLAASIAATLVDRQDGHQAAVSIHAPAQVADHAPASGLATVEPYDLVGLAAVDLAQGTARRALGVTATGMNACPCAQQLVREQARDDLQQAGFDAAQIERILEVVPVASHNQRGTATLVVGTEVDLDPLQLLDVVWGSMSARTRELLKRDDELAVVVCAHSNPMFVEDGVRAMLADCVARDWGLADGDIVQARLRNSESIHAHDVFAERVAPVGDLRRELAGGAVDARPAASIEAWLRGA